jgi:hypothetical protein
MPASLTSPQMSDVAPRRETATRIDPLDWTKGALVLFMVAYHCINYSVYKPQAFRFLPFLPPSFVLIAGLVVGLVYSSRYDLGTWQPYVRLLVRGGKLLLLFVLLNLGFCIMSAGNVVEGGWDFADRAGPMFFSGNGREGIFEVLLPIAYFLLLVPLLLWLRSRFASAILCCAVAIFVLCTVLEKTGRSSENLTLLSAGVLGMALGLIPLQAINRLARQWVPVLSFYFLYQFCRWYGGDIYPVEMFGAAASVFLLYTIALHLDLARLIGRQVVLLGRYSLLGYLTQIALIRIIVKLGGGKPEHVAGVVGVGLLTAILVWGLVTLVNSLRPRYRPADLIYRWIFA